MTSLSGGSPTKALVEGRYLGGDLITVLDVQCMRCLKDDQQCFRCNRLVPDLLQLGMSGAALEADIRGHDKCDANDPQRTSSRSKALRACHPFLITDA